MHYYFTILNIQVFKYKLIHNFSFHISNTSNSIQHIVIALLCEIVIKNNTTKTLLKQYCNNKYMIINKVHNKPLIYGCHVIF